MNSMQQKKLIEMLWRKSSVFEVWAPVLRHGDLGSLSPDRINALLTDIGDGLADPAQHREVARLLRSLADALDEKGFL